MRCVSLCVCVCGFGGEEGSEGRGGRARGGRRRGLLLVVLQRVRRVL